VVLDLKVLMVNRDRKEHLEQLELLDPPAHRELRVTQALQDLLVRMDLQEYRVLQDKVEARVPLEALDRMDHLAHQG